MIEQVRLCFETFYLCCTFFGLGNLCILTFPSLTAKKIIAVFTDNTEELGICLKEGTLISTSEARVWERDY